MDTAFKALKQAIEKLNSSLEGELEEVRRNKAELLQLKHEMIAEKTKGYYIRDDHRIVISAPEIIIGDVDRSGNLAQSDGTSTVIIRANNIGLDGVGSADGVSGSRIESRAALIRQIAVDPGIDGMENVVGQRSEILNQARSITLHSADEQGVFSSAPAVLGSGITLHSDTLLHVDASLSNSAATTRIDEQIKALKTAKSDLASQIKARKKNVTDTLDTLDKLLGSDSSYAGDEDIARTNAPILYQIQEAVQLSCHAAARALEEYYPLMARLAEVNRQIKVLDEQKKALSAAKSNYEKTTSATLSLNAQNINLTTNDGDGKQREENAGVSIVAPSLNVSARKPDSSLIKDSTISLSAQDIVLSTTDMQNLDEKGENGKMPAVGNVNVFTKTLNVQAVDNELKSNAIEEVDITAESAITLRAETISAEAYTKDGKSTGSIDLSAKTVTVAAIDKKLEPDKPAKNDKLSEGGQLILSAEKTLVGSLSKDRVTKTLQLAGDKTGIFGNTTTEVQQGEGKAVLTLDGGNVTLGGSKNEFVGATTVNATMEVKGEVKAPKVTGDNIEAKTSFKTANISDGVAVPGAPPSAQVSAKLKAEEVKAE